jgi:hypothetical protein
MTDARTTGISLFFSQFISVKIVITLCCKFLHQRQFVENPDKLNLSRICSVWFFIFYGFCNTANLKTNSQFHLLLSFIMIKFVAVKHN